MKPVLCICTPGSIQEVLHWNLKSMYHVWLLCINVKTPAPEQHCTVFLLLIFYVFSVVLLLCLSTVLTCICLMPSPFQVCININLWFCRWFLWEQRADYKTGKVSGV